MEIIYLGIGTNQGNRENNLSNALELIEKKAGRLISSSSVYETDPWGFESSQLFLNMVVKVETELSPYDLLDAVHLIESELGRKRGKTRYVSRIMDIDILFYGEEVIAAEDLVIPHPLICDRKFVLIPLAEIESAFVHPVFKTTIKTLLDSCRDNSRVNKVY